MYTNVKTALFINTQVCWFTCSVERWFPTRVVKTAERKRFTGNVFSNVWRQRFQKSMVFFWWSPGGSTWASIPSFVSNCKSYSPKMRSIVASCTIILCIPPVEDFATIIMLVAFGWWNALTIQNVVPKPHMRDSGWTSRALYVIYIYP